MVQFTMQVPEDLAVRIQPLSQWLPTIIRLSLLGFKTSAISTVTELIDFLQQNPTPQEFLHYHVSEHSQKRLHRLLTLNESGLLGNDELAELDELQRLEHFVILLKAQLSQAARS